MNVSLYQAAAAMNANSRWQEVISENLSAGGVPGFKRQELPFSAIQAGMQPSPQFGSAQSFSLPISTPVTNFSQGELRVTKSPTDFAIEGDAFFEVQLPDGSHAFTRDGEFKLGPQGQLLTKQGFSVLNESGPLRFNPAQADAIQVAPTGEIHQGVDAKGTLKLATFADPRALTPLGDGLFLAKAPQAQPQPAVGCLVRQGFTEASNTSSLTEMSNLIMAMRGYEANQKVIQTQDERMGRAISELGAAS